jgi:hypothetical protein
MTAGKTCRKNAAATGLFLCTQNHSASGNNRGLKGIEAGPGESNVQKDFFAGFHDLPCKTAHAPGSYILRDCLQLMRFTAAARSADNHDQRLINSKIPSAFHIRPSPFRFFSQI